MFLITKNSKRAICRQCAKLHPPSAKCSAEIVGVSVDGTPITRRERDAIYQHCKRSVEQALRRQNAG